MPRFFLLSFVFLCVSFVFGVDRPLKIGIVAPLTGNEVVAGQALKNSLLLAQADNPDFKTNLFFEDTQSTSSGTNLAAHRLINLNHVDVIFTPYTQQANIVAPLTEKAGVLQVSCCWNSDVVERSRFLISNSVSYKNYGDAIIAILKKKGITRAALVSNAIWIEGTRWLRERCPKEGITLVADETYNNDDRDFRTSILRMKELKPQMTVVYLQYPSCDIFLKQLHELIPDATDKLTGYLDLVTDRSLIEGATYISEYPPIPEFYARYQRRFGVSAEQTLAPNVYDSYQILAKVSAEMPKWSVKAAADKFRATKNFPGITGSLTCAPSGVFLSQTQTVKIVKGQKEFLKE